MNYLSVDQGGSGSRAIICDAQGAILAQAAVSVSTHYNCTFIEQSPIEVSNSLQYCIQKCLAAVSKQNISITAASLITQRSSLIAINSRTKQPLTNIISWQDTRGAQLLEGLKIDARWLMEKTGLTPSAHYGASKMSWLLLNNIDVKKAADKNELLFLPIASYLAAQLTQNFNYTVDPVNATRTLLFSFFKYVKAPQEKQNDQQKGKNKTWQWDDELLALFKIKKSWLPIIKDSDHHIGQLNYLNQSIPLTHLNGDQSAALFAYGQPKKTELTVNMGTGAFISFLKTPCQNHIKPPENLLQSLIYTRASASTRDNLKNPYELAIEGTVNGAGSAIEFMSKYLDVNPRDINAATKHNPTIPIFINTIGGLGSPYWSTDKPWAFVANKTTDSDEQSRQNKMIAVIESVVFLISVNIMHIKAIHTSLTQISITGGLANRPDIGQLLADLTNITVIKKPQIEASALGAIWLLKNQYESAKQYPQQERHKNKWLPHINSHQYIKYTPQVNSDLRLRFERWQNEMTNLMQ